MARYYKKKMQKGWEIFKEGAGNDLVREFARSLSKAFHVGYALGRNDEEKKNFEAAKKDHDLSHPDPFEGV